MADENPRAKAISKLMRFFGRQPGQGLKEFAAETKALTDADVEQLATGIENGTLTY